MIYEVHVVDDSGLPDGVDYAFAVVDGQTYRFIKESCLRSSPEKCKGLTRAFTTWERAQTGPPIKHLVAV